MIFPTQKIDSKKKDKTWARRCIDFVIAEGNSTLRSDIIRMLSNYRLINSQMEEEEMRSICKVLGVNEKAGKKYISMYNKTPNILSTLKGEELDRPFTWTVTSLTDQPDSKYIRDQEIEYSKIVDEIFKLESEKISKIIEIEVQNELQNIPEDKKEQAIQELEAKYKEKYSKILDIESIESKRKNILKEKESAISNLMKIAFRRIDMRFIKNECFSDAAIAGKEFVEITFEPGNPIPIIRQLNPTNVFYHKSPDSPFTHDSDYVGYQEEITLGQALDHYGELMTDNEIKRLQTFSYDNTGKYGTSDSMFHTRADRHASSWSAKREAGMFPSGANIDPQAMMVMDGKYMGIPTSSYTNGNNIYGPGLYADSRTYNGRYVSVYTVYWKSYRKVYKYTYTDEYNELCDEIVDESFVVPDNYKTEKYRPTPFADYKTKKIWYDDDDKYNCIEEMWIPEIWKGVRLNGDIYVNVGPLENAYQSLINPYKTKIPVLGFIYNSRNTGILSIVDRLQSWQKLYYAVMARLVKNLSQDKGVLTFLNSLMVSDEIGLKATLAMAEDGNITPYNPLAYSKGNVGVMNTMKVAERIDATNSTVIQYYIQLLQFIENQMIEAVGMSPQRLAKTKVNTTATDNQRETMHSMNITEPLYYAHDLLWEKICQTYMEMLISSLSESKGKFRGMIDDKHMALIDLELLSLEDEYLIKISNNIKNNKILDIMKSQVHAIIQNDKANLSTLISMLKTDDLTELEDYLLDLETKMSKQEEMREQSRREQEEKIEKMRLEQREDEQIAKLQSDYLNNIMKRNTDIEREHIRGKYLITSYNLQNDNDADGIPDIMEADIKYKKFINDVAAREEKINSDRLKLLLDQEEMERKKKEHEDKMQLEREKLKQQNTKQA
jgi:hypothetical protein